MNLFKRISAAALVAVMALSFTACHKKGEIAVKVGDSEFTSAYYMCALIDADLAAKNEIDTKAQSDTSIDKSKEDYYYTQKIDGKSFEAYVKEQALEKLKENAAYIKKCKDEKVEIKDDELSSTKSYVEAMWTSYGYSQVYEPNGVSKETYLKYTMDSYYAEQYFNHLYGKDGTKAVTDKEIKSYRKDNYLLADILDVDLSSEQDATKSLKKTQIETYYKDLKAGKTDFKTVYETYNSIEDSQKQDSYSQVIGSDATDNPNENYDTVKKMKKDEVKLITKDNDAGYTIIVKRDLEKDKTQTANLDSTIRHALKDDEFKKDIADFAKTLKFTEIKSATKQFKVKKIEYPQNDSQNA